MAKMKITFKGFDALATAIDRAGKDLKKASEEALNATQEIVQENLRQAASSYAVKGGGRKGYATGRMYQAILENPHVEWEGSVAYVKVGFDLKKAGGIHSIFVMYGTPRMEKDVAIYNAIRGAKTQKEIDAVQKKILESYLGLNT